MKLADPALYLSAHEEKLVILDEVQRLPGLFQALRGLIDKGRRRDLRAGRFLLLGSASIDFGYGGEISSRPTERPSLRELGEYNYFRRNRAGVQREWWFHRSGCRAWFIAERDTTTNEVLLTELPGSAGGDGAA